MTWRRWVRWVAALGVLLSIGVMWSVSYVPTQDGPAHLYIASVLRLMAAGPGSVFADFFQTNWNYQPNLFAYAALYTLLGYVPPEIAEKLLISLYLISLPLAAAFTAWRGGGRPALMALLTLPVALSHTFFMGFYNYGFSQVLFLIGLGLWFGLAERPTAGRHAALGLAALLAFFCHIFGAAALLFVAACGTVWRIAADGRSQDAGTLTLSDHAIRLLRQGWPVALALLPTFILILEFVINREGASGGTGDDFLRRLLLLVTFSFVIALNPADWIFAVGYLAVAAFMTYQAVRQRRQAPLPSDTMPLCIASLAFVGLYFAMPANMSGSSFVMERLLPFIYLTFALWFSSLPASRLFLRNVAVFLAALGVALPVYRYAQMRDIDGQLSPYYALAEHIGEGSTLLALRVDLERRPGFSRTTNHRINPFIHASMRISAKKQLVDLKVSQANGSEAPLHYRKAMNPIWWLQANLDHPPEQYYWRELNLRLGGPLAEVDIPSYEARIGRRIDYLLLWGPYDEVAEEADVTEFVNGIMLNFIPVHIASSEFRLLRRKNRGVVKGGEEIAQ